MIKPTWRRFAPWGLYLALAAAVAAAGIYIIFQTVNLPLQISLGVILLGLVVFIVLDPHRVGQIFTGRNARYGSNALILMIAFVGILAVINFLFYQNSKRWDLTQDKEHTLAPETINMLKSLSKTVTATAYYTKQISSDTARGLLEDFKSNAAGKFEYRFVDPNADPVSANQAGITSDGTIVLSMGSAHEMITYASEQELTAALLRLTNPGTRVVYFLAGHGEGDPESADNPGYSKAKDRLTAKNYTVKKLNLIAEKQIPADATVIVIAGPIKPVTTDEMTLLKDYVAKGGSLLVEEMPVPLTQYGNAADPLADYLVKDWGIKLGDDLVIDLSANPVTVAVASQYGSHPITQKLQGMVSIYPTARSVQSVTPAPQGLQNTVLVTTADRSWGETDYEALKNNQVKFDQSKDLAGPVPLAVASENSSINARVVVFGDTLFACNNYFDQYGNADMFINSVDWAAKQDKLINLTPKTTTQRVLVPPQTYGMGLVLFGSIFLVPGLVILMGIVTWLRRRSRG